MNIEESIPDSMTDRIAAQFDNQTEAPPEEQQEVEAQAETTESEETPGVVDVEFGGKSYQVPPELKDALMAQSDYTKKTSEVAEKARLLEVKAQEYKARESEKAFQESVKDDILAMQRLDFQIDQYKNVDATGLNSDQLWQLSRTIDKLKDDRAKLSETVTGKYQGWQTEMTKAAQESLAKAQEVAAKAIPNWSPETQKEIVDFAVAQGFEANEVKGITDPRVVKILWQAKQFAKLQSAKLTGKVTNAPAVKPGSSNPMPQGVKNDFALRKAQQNPKLNSSQRAKIIQQRLEGSF